MTWQWEKVKVKVSLGGGCGLGRLKKIRKVNETIVREERVASAPGFVVAHRQVS